MKVRIGLFLGFHITIEHLGSKCVNLKSFDNFSRRISFLVVKQEMCRFMFFNGLEIGNRNRPN